MGAQLRVVRQRIRATKSIAKITRAQELIASSRIVKAQARMQAAQPYAREITNAVSALISHAPNIEHPLLTERTEQRTRAAVVLLTSDSGFCGGFNANVLREGQALAAKLREENVEPVPFIAGVKGVTWYRFRQLDIEQEWTGFSNRPTYADAERVGQALVEAFSKPEDEGGVDEIHVVYTEFVSMLTQRAVVRRILPLVVEESDEEPPTGALADYEFEPEPEEVLDALLPNYVESRLWAMMLQSAASEWAAKRRAMKSATDNANDLISDLTRVANQARQAEITQEISEIVGGADALAEANAGSE
jgi:F-type H+-transporting ATPase subunit gamma